MSALSERGFILWRLEGTAYCTVTVVKTNPKTDDRVEMRMETGK